jgi:pimeloyl-ACP methyl ester carboxylesterase
MFGFALRPSAADAQADTGTTAAGLFYEISGSGPPVVLIHAFSLDRRMWQPQLDALQREFRVIRYDLRGHGRSVAPLEPYAAYEDLRGVLDALGIDRAALVGLSAGAQIATDFALVYPERVTRLLLASPGLGGFVPKEPLTWFQPVAEAARAGNIDLATRLWAATPLMAIRNNPGASLVSEIVAGNARVWSYRANPERKLTPPAIERLNQIRCPVLVVVGDDDLPMIKDVAEILGTRISGAHRVSIPVAGHLVNIAAPASFNRLLLAFLRPERVSPTGQPAGLPIRRGP